MPINLPTTPVSQSCVLSVQEFGGAMGGALGGPTQIVRRLGDRMAAKFSFPAMDADCADAFIAARMRARTEGQTIIAAWPNQAWAGSLGSPKFDGAGQTGSLLDIKGLNPGAKLKKGYVFSWASAARTYLHVLTAAVTADSDGKASVHLGPMIRGDISDGDDLNFTAPQIEGFIVEPTEWTLERLRWKGMSFTLAENA